MTGSTSSSPTTDEEAAPGIKSPKIWPTRIPYWRMVFDPAGITPEVADFPYSGSGTEQDPFLVRWISRDPRNPMQFGSVTKWSVTMLVALATLAVTLISSAYSGAMDKVEAELAIGHEVATLGVSLFVLGFAVGPLLWAPLSELFGRRPVFVGTYAALTALNAGCAASNSAGTLLALRFLAGAFGSSPLTNADMFAPSQRGLALALFAAAPFLGPVLSPAVGGFLGQAAGWRWVMGLLTVLSGSLWLLGCVCLPETYAPVLLRRRAAALSAATGRVYLSASDAGNDGPGPPTLRRALATALRRPWILLFREPIVLLLSVFMAVVYGTLYMLFSAFPIVYIHGRGWTPGIGGLAFLGIMIGMLAAIAVTIPSNRRYQRVEAENDGLAPPEARLPPAMLGAVALPIGLFWFAWTNSPTTPWPASVAAGISFGFGLVLVFLGVMNYLIDAYTIFAASVLAANALLRSLFGASFPLFAPYMYRGLGIHWASCVPGFLALACLPFPFLFYRHEAAIRGRCRFAARSAEFVRKLHNGDDDGDGDGGDGCGGGGTGGAHGEESDDDDEVVEDKTVKGMDQKGHEEQDDDGNMALEKDKSTADGRRDGDDDDGGGGGGNGGNHHLRVNHSHPVAGTLSRSSARTTSSSGHRGQKYEGNPYDVDHVNSHTAF